MLTHVILAAFLLTRPPADMPPVAAPSPALVQSLHLDPVYRKHSDAHGLPVLGSARPSDYALREAAWLVDRMLEGRNDVRQALIHAHVRVVVMAFDEMTTAVPEYHDLTPAKYWDKRARGLGATRERPVVSCGEENLLGFRGDPYTGENILIHEFAHAIHGIGLKEIDRGFDARLTAAWERAMAAGLWKGTYAATNRAEYWAEGVQSWFDCNQGKNHSHNGIRSREQLQAYDPELAALIAAAFEDNPWRYSRPDQRTERGHLAGYDPARAPAFAWDPALVEWYRKYEEVKSGKP